MNRVVTRTQIILLAAAVLTAWHLQCIALEGAIANSYPPVVQGKALSGGSSVAVDADGNRYIAVYCNTTRDFDPGPGADVQVHFGSTTYNDVFVTRYNADGSYAWTQVYAGSGDEQPFAIAVDDTHVYVAGQSSSYDARIGLNGPIVVPAGDTDAFVVALDKETGAAANWGLGGSGIQMFGGSVDDRAFGVASDGTNVYVAGHFYSNNAQIGGAGLSVATTGVADAFVIALDAATGLAANWGLSGSGIQTFAGTNDDFGRAVAADGAAVYMAGYFASTNAKIGGAGTAIGTSGSQDGFVIALDAATGAALGWGRSASGIQTFGGSTAQDRALAITVDASRVYAK